MKRCYFTPVCRGLPVMLQAQLLADIAFDPGELVPPDDQSALHSQSWMTIAGTGLLLCAVVALVVRRLKMARQSRNQSGTGINNASSGDQ